MTTGKYHDGPSRITLSYFHLRPVRCPDLSTSENQQTAHSAISTATLLVYIRKPMILPRRQVASQPA